MIPTELMTFAEPPARTPADGSPVCMTTPVNTIIVERRSTRNGSESHP